MPTATMSSIVVYTYTSLPTAMHGVTVICPLSSSLVIPLVDEHMHASSIKLEAHCVFLDVML